MPTCTHARRGSAAGWERGWMCGWMVCVRCVCACARARVAGACVCVCARVCGGCVCGGVEGGGYRVEVGGGGGGQRGAVRLRRLDVLARRLVELGEHGFDVLAHVARLRPTRAAH
eukprot:3352579-Prymnesium_polylepis.1